MTIQEEIREGMYSLSFWPSDFQVYKSGTVSLGYKAVKKILAYLHSQGVVIKVDKELAYSVEDSYVSPEAMETIKKAGYVVVEPLIEESK